MAMDNGSMKLQFMPDDALHLRNGVLLSSSHPFSSISNFLTRLQYSSSRLQFHTKGSNAFVLPFQKDGFQKYYSSRNIQCPSISQSNSKVKEDATKHFSSPCCKRQFKLIKLVPSINLNSQTKWFNYYYNNIQKSRVQVFPPLIYEKLCTC